MERRLHRTLYFIQIPLLLLIAGCGGRKDSSPILLPQEEGKTGITIQEAHFLQSDARGRKILEIWATSSEGEEEKLTLKGVRSILYEGGKPFAELSAPSAIYQPNKGLLFLNKGAKLNNLDRKSETICDFLEVLFKERKIKGRGISLKWGDVTLEGKEFQADWGLKKGMLKNDAVVKINMKRRTR